MKSNLAMIKKEADIFGLLFLGHGAIISICPLLNILYYGENVPVAVLQFFYCQGRLTDGNKKCGTLICNLFLKHTKETYPALKLSDIVISNLERDV